MPDSDDVVREAYRAYARGDLAGMLEFVDPDLEWTYLDPGLADPTPQVCRGRRELRIALERQSAHGLRSELEEVVGNGERVLVVVHTPGADAHRARKTNDRNYDVATVREGHIVALRACRDREEAASLVGVD